MADPFQSNPSFVNPSYVTPEQLRSLRAQSEALLKRSGQDVNRPLGAVANMIDALNSNLTRNRADTMQSEAAAANAGRLGTTFSQMQSGKPIDPTNLAQVYADPMASPEARALVSGLVNPQGAKDAYGRPGYASPLQGVQATPVAGNFQPGNNATVSSGDTSVTNVPMPAPRPGGPIPSSARVVGDKEGVDRGLYPPPGGGLPPAAANTIRDVAGLGRELSAARTFSQGGAESVTGTVKEDIAAAMGAPTIKRIAGTMLDDLRTHGDKMTFGPTAEWSNTVKKAAANYAPGFMRDQLEGLASADSFDKMSAQLASMLAKGGGTDAQLFNNMRSVPGAHNSKQGAEALLLMVNQVADQQQALREHVAGARNAQEYEALRSDFFRKNPVVNPITGNPIAQDLQRGNAGGGGGARIIAVRPAQ